jgi:hypothetical protein
MHLIRPSVHSDLPALERVLDATGLFPSELLGGMTSGFFAGETEGETWLTLDDGGPVALASYVPERLTEGTVERPGHRGAPRRAGARARLGAHAPHRAGAGARGERVLLVETSGVPAFDRTRAFYRGLGYDEEARIRDFYAAGDDKVIFRKAL